MDNIRNQIREALEESEKPTKALRESIRNLASIGIAEAAQISAIVSYGQREMAWADSISRATADFEKASRLSAFDKIDEMERFFRPLQIDAAAIDHLTRPFRMDRAEFAKLTNPFSSQIEQFKKFQDGIFGIDAASRVGDVEAMLSGSQAYSEKMLQSLATSAIADAFNTFEWKKLSATFASAAEATNQAEIHSAVTKALAASKSDEANTSSSLNDFLQALLKVSGADGVGKLLVWYFIFELLKTILIAASISTTDYYVKDYLSKTAQAEDRRALAKEVAKEIGKLGLAREYVSVRRYATKSLDVHMNPRAKSPVIGSVRVGELVEVIQVGRDWTHVVFRDSRGKEFSGWAYTRYLKTLPSGQATVEE